MRPITEPAANRRPVRIISIPSPASDIRVLLHDTIAILFDFDDTLGPDSTSGFLERLGVDVPVFWTEEVQPLLDANWDPVPAYMGKMLEWSRAGRIPPITREAFALWGKELRVYDGVQTLFDRLRQQCQHANPRARLEFYLVSSGIGDILRHNRIAHEFVDIWASDFAYDSEGRITALRKIVSFTDKTRYVFHVQKGLVGPESRGKPFDVNRNVPPAKLRVPLNMMIVVGDGYTDVPCFSLVKASGGIAIGVFDPENRKKWGRAWGFIEDGRVSNLVPADYAPNSALSTFLSMAVENLARRLALAGNTYQG